MKRPMLVVLFVITVLLLSACYRSSGFERKRSASSIGPATESYYQLR